MRVCKPWDDDSHQIVATEYPTADLSALAKKLGRTIAAVKRYAQMNGIKRPRKSTKGYRYVQRKERALKPSDGAYFKAGPAAELLQAIGRWAR